MPDPHVELRLTAQDQTRAAIQSVQAGLGRLNHQIEKIRHAGRLLAEGFLVFHEIIEPLKKLAEEAIHGGAELSGLSERTGITVEQLSALSHTAKISHTDLSAVAIGAKRLSVNMLEAATGGKKAQQLLAAFGITAKDDLLTAFSKISERLKELPEGWQRNAAAVKLFGKAGDQLVPFLLNLAAGLEDAKNKNLIFSESVAKASHEIEASLATIHEQLTVTLARALELVLPKLQAFLDAVQEGIATGGFTGGIDAILLKLQELGGVLGSVAQLLREHGQAVLTVIEAYVGFRILAGIRGLILPLVEGLIAAGTAAGTAAEGAVGLRVALLALGGPIGIIATAVTGLGVAFAYLATQGNEAGTTAGRALGQAKGAAEGFRAALASGHVESKQIAAALEEGKKSLEAQRAIITDEQRRLKGASGHQAVGISEGLKRARAIAADLGAEVEQLGNQFSVAVRAEEAAAKAAAKPPPPDLLEQLKKPSKVPKVGAGTKNDAKALIDAGLAATQDALDREQRALDVALDDELVSFRAFYARRTAIALAGIDAEIAAKREALAQSKDQGDIARITSEITILERKRGDVAVQARHDQIKAERELADQLAGVRARVLEAEGHTAEAARIRIEAEFRELRARLVAEGDQAGLDWLDRLINKEAARAKLGEIQVEFDRLREQLSRDETRVHVEVDTGLTGELAGRREIVRLHTETAAKLAPIVDQMRIIAGTIGPEEIARVGGLAAEVENLGTVTNEVANDLNNEFKNAAASAFTDFLTGAKTAQQAFADFGSAILDAIAKIAAKNIAEEVFGDLFKSTKKAGGGSTGGLFDFLGGLFHQGGIAGVPGPGRRVPALAFAGAPRLHDGGALGLRSNEVPAILQRGEEVLTRGDPRHRANQGGGDIHVHMQITTPDAASFRRSQGEIAVQASTAIGRAARNRP